MFDKLTEYVILKNYKSRKFLGRKKRMNGSTGPKARKNFNKSLSILHIRDCPNEVSQRVLLATIFLRFSSLALF